ncbi:ATP-binding protein [Poseidonocella sedimentorum]|uniref:histidine kinase n=1 Tax=Poseidonocella sedimentorum TaxID=871652 RepID=A0A1I6DNW9_9RHOB|nr:ATP-binding protein [Poseidonocella sedimentorum]SFR07125.1 histidine kinase [Poseidonocella sedimentorum]
MDLITKLAEERRERLAAQRKLELKQAELDAANRKIQKMSGMFNEQIANRRAEMARVLDENFRVKSDLTVANKRVRIAERRLWESIEAIEGGFAVYDQEDRLVIANTAYLEIFEGLEEIAPEVPYGRVVEILCEEGIVNPGGLSKDEWTSMMVDRWKDGARAPISIRTFDDRYFQLIDERGGDGETVSLAIDVTKSVIREEELKTARKIAEEANSAKSTFLANISHEIRTPMNGILGMSELLGETELAEDQELFTSTIRTSAEALLVIINDILDFSKIEAGKMVLKPEVFDLERCLQEILLLLLPTCRDKQIELEVDYDIFMPTRFFGDQGRFRQILTNLIGNAVKFTLEGQVTVRVTGIPNTDDGTCSLRLTVEDTGIGIPEDKTTQIFDEFTQADDAQSREFEGTGLGLAISRRLVKMMGGEIWVQSVEGEGTIFGISLELPIDEAYRTDPTHIPDTLGRALLFDPRGEFGGDLERLFAEFAIGFSAVEATPSLAAIPEGLWDVLLVPRGRGAEAGELFVQALRAQGDATPVVLIGKPPPGLRATQEPPPDTVPLDVPILRRALFEALHKVADILKRQEEVAAFGEDSEADQDAAFASGPDARAMRVLVAEDNQTNRLVIKKMLEDCDIELRCVENGAAALTAFEAETPDLIFMDVSMPVMDGQEAARQIRAMPGPGATVPIVAVTAHASPEDEAAILASGMTRFLTKPLQKAALLETIHRYAPSDIRRPLPPGTKTGFARAG